MCIPSVYQTRFIFRLFRHLQIVLLMIATGSALARPALSDQQSETTAAAIPTAAPATAKTTNPAAKQAISTSVLETDYGLQILHIAVTAAGGLIDFRFKILDPEKARKILKDPNQLPTLIAEDSGLVLNPTKRLVGSVRLQKDAVCYILYPNARNAVKAGISVSAVFGNVRVEPIKAQ